MNLLKPFEDYMADHDQLMEGRKEKMWFYVTFNSLDDLMTRQKPGTRRKFPSLHE